MRSLSKRPIMKISIFILALIFQFFALSQCPKASHIELIRQAMTLKNELASNYWKEWKSVPMTLLFVTEQKEYLFNRVPNDSSFELVCDSIYSRNTTQPINLLAAFPLVDWKPTIVVGQPDNTNTRSIEHFLMTLLHEHFHQFQYANPEYFERSNGLGLAKDENDFMWQLNYAFPYDNPEVEKALSEMQSILLDFITTRKMQVDQYLKAKERLRAVISEKDYRYLGLQLWQEGFARFVEIELLQDWVENYDEIPISKFPKDLLLKLEEQYIDNIKTDLEHGRSSEMKRVVFYSLGAAEAMLIQATNPYWKESYFNNLFNTDMLF